MSSANYRDDVLGFKGGEGAVTYWVSNFIEFGILVIEFGTLSAVGVEVHST
ncbi:hypothetical protein D9M69_712430 [compost metagenome]